MQTIEIRKGVQVGFDDLVGSVSRMDTADLKKVLEQINEVLSLRGHQQPSEREAQLLQQIRDVVPASVTRRYRQLHKKQQNGSITAKEREEMLLLTDFMEEKSAERVMLLGALADIRQTTITELTKQLRIREFHA
jgi:hypothetical protein